MAGLRGGLDWVRTLGQAPKPTWGRQGRGAVSAETWRIGGSQVGRLGRVKEKGAPVRGSRKWERGCRASQEPAARICINRGSRNAGDNVYWDMLPGDEVKQLSLKPQRDPPCWGAGVCQEETCKRLWAEDKWKIMLTATHSSKTKVADWRWWW